MKMKIAGISLVLFLVSVSPSLAHSGRTNSAGCHNCYTGSCAGTYHCHGGGTYIPPSQPIYQPTQTIVKPTIKPTVTTTPTPSSSPIITIAPTPIQTPQVQGATTSDNPVADLLGVAVVVAGGWFGLKWLGKKSAPSEPTDTA